MARSKFKTAISNSNRGTLGFSSVSGVMVGSTTSVSVNGSNGCIGTSNSTPHLTSSRSTIVALNESRGLNPQIGLASFDLKTFKSHLYQFSDTKTYARTLYKLNLLDPVEIIIPNSIVTNESTSRLLITLESLFEHISLTTLNRKYFNDATGLQYVEELGVDNSLINIPGISDKYYCLAATAALFKYVEEIERIMFHKSSIHFKFEAIEGIMMMDIATARYLELTSKISVSKSSKSLFDVLNYTKTSMGARTLRTSILQPLYDQGTINQRLVAVEELIRNEHIRKAVETRFTKIGDVDHLITSLIRIPKNPDIGYIEKSLNAIVSLKTTINVVSELRECLASVQSPLLMTIFEILEDENITHIKNCIDLVIEQDVQIQKGPIGMRNQRCYAIKSGFNGLLDVARQTYKESSNDIHELVSKYRDDYELPFELGFTPTTGYFITLLKSDLEEAELPREFINAASSGKKIKFTSLQLMSYNDRINESLTEVYLNADKIIFDLIAALREHVLVLFHLSDGMGLLDMLASLAFAAARFGWIMPEFTETLAIKNGKHPIKNYIDPDALVANDVFSDKETTFMLITGPNMSGKSTYLKQIALLQILYQMGSYVSAEYGSFKLIDSLFSRIGHDDNLLANASSFTTEMREISYILDNATDKSLVIVDELGRGTSVTDGLAICFSVCKELIDKRSTCFFVSHFHELHSLLRNETALCSLDLQIKNGDDDLVEYLYKVSDVVSTNEHYGIKMAKQAGMHEEILKEAIKISNLIINESNRPHRATDVIMKEESNKHDEMVDDEQEQVQKKEDN